MPRFSDVTRTELTWWVLLAAFLTLTMWSVSTCDRTVETRQSGIHEGTVTEVIYSDSEPAVQIELDGAKNIFPVTAEQLRVIEPGDYLFFNKDVLLSPVTRMPLNA